MARKNISYQPKLNAAEKRVIEAAGRGELADCSDLGSSAQIRATVLQQLIIGLPQSGSKTTDPVTPRGLRIKGATITGELNLKGWSARSDDPARPLPSIEFTNCSFTHPVVLDDCHIQGLEMVACHVPALFAESAHINDPVRLNGSIIQGVTHANGLGTYAIFLDRARLDGGLFLRPHGDQCFHARAQIRAQSTVFGGDFSAIGARLEGQDGIALDLFTSIIHGNIFFVWRGDHTFYADGDILLVGLQVSGGYMAAEATMLGKVDLSHSHVQVLADGPVSGWPQKAGQILLSGFTYNRLRIVNEHRKENLARQRLDWLKRQYENPEQPSCDEFDPQPFHQLAKVMREQGMNEEADSVAIEMRRLRLAAKIDPWYLRPIQHFLDISCRFGYSGSRAVLSLAIWILIGTTLFGYHAFVGSFAPAEAVMIGNHEVGQNTYTTLLPFPPVPQEGADLTTGWYQTLSRGCPGLVAPLYAIDVILPVIEFGQRRACAFDPQGPLAPMWRFLQLLYALIGAILGAITVVTLTGLLRKD